MRFKPPYLLVIDQGTTSTRAMLFDSHAAPAASHAIELRQHYPANGWVEHDPDEIWNATVKAIRAAAKDLPAADIAAIGITNQRETTVLWDRETGAPVHPAIVWQDRRTAQRCRELREEGHAERIAQRTGLVVDPYFSATKLEWLLDHVEGARTRAERGELAFGTIDSWLIWRLTDGARHVTDTTNASRTMLFNLATLDWDAELLDLFRVPREVLPDVQRSASEFGVATNGIPGEALPILGVAGDQQAATFGQACFRPGEVKSTYGTGCFALVHTGQSIALSHNRLIATAAAQSGPQRAYAIEGSIFIAGAVVQWLRDGLALIRNSSEIEALAARARETQGLYFVPAFTGLGAPYWDPDARAAIVGLTRDSGAAEIARAALDAVCLQTRDLLEAMRGDMRRAGLEAPAALRVDGGMVKNDLFCQRLADLTGLPVDRPTVTETTALGAAYLAGLAAGVFRDEDEIAAKWARDRRFEPQLGAAARDALYAGWQGAVARVRSSAS